MKIYQIRGYSKTGIYCVEVEATNHKEALKQGKAEIAKISFGKVGRYIVNEEV